MDKRFFIVIALLIIGAGITLFLKPVQIEGSLDPRIASFPDRIGDYVKVKDLNLEDKIYGILETRNIVLRQYQKGTEPPVLLYIIFAPRTHKTSDPPENCLVGDGMSVLKKDKVSVDAGDKPFYADKLVAEDARGRFMYFYWFLAGDEFTGSYAAQRMKLIMAALRLDPLSGGQIRISTQVMDSEDSAQARLNDFLKTAYPEFRSFLGRK